MLALLCALFINSRYFCVRPTGLKPEYCDYMTVQAWKPKKGKVVNHRLRDELMEGIVVKNHYKDVGVGIVLLVGKNYLYQYQSSTSKAAIRSKETKEKI